MSISTRSVPRSEIVYPDSDGQPMAENTLQFQWIVTIKEGLDHVFHRDPNVFVAGDLLWYPVEGDPKIRQAPDALVAFGRPKGYRGSYRQWEEGGICTPGRLRGPLAGKPARKMTQKFQFYEKYGVDEYYIYDPDNVKLDRLPSHRGPARKDRRDERVDEPTPGYPLRYVRAGARDLRPGWPAIPDLPGAGRGTRSCCRGTRSRRRGTRSRRRGTRSRRRGTRSAGSPRSRSRSRATEDRAHDRPVAHDGARAAGVTRAGSRDGPTVIQPARRSAIDRAAAPVRRMAIRTAKEPTSGSSIAT